MAKEYYIRVLGDPVLRQKCSKVTDYSQLEELLSEMSGLLAIRGIGIAAPQVGEPVCVILGKIDGIITEFINPAITYREGSIIVEEGCLSVPGQGIKKQRNTKINVEYNDRFGNFHTGTFENINAVLLQHEIDHLEGKLIIDP
ncbi:MAG: peptide deformylase [Candidatus Nanoarchaeia archaeon]|jgi:peptide deformylase